MVLEVGPCASGGSCAYLKGRILTADFLLITTTAMSKNQPAFLCLFLSACLLLWKGCLLNRERNPSPYSLCPVSSLGIGKWSSKKNHTLTKISPNQLRESLVCLFFFFLKRGVKWVDGWVGGKAGGQRQRSPENRLLQSFLNVNWP